MDVDGATPPTTGALEEQIGSGCTTCVHVCALTTLSALLFWWIGLREPILRDHAWFLYLGQTILRGEPIYANSFFGYPPLGPVATAGAMWLGKAFGAPTYLAPRIAGMAIFHASVILAYFVARRATRSAAAGLATAIVLASFSHFQTYSATDIEPKTLVILFSLAAAAAVQRRAWVFVGVFTGLAGMCWQPAVLVAISTFTVTLWNGRRKLWQSIARYALGIGLGCAPAAAYLTVSRSWLDFWQRGIVIPATTQVAAETGATWWLLVMRVFFAGEWYFFLLGGAGFALFAIAALASGPGAAWRRFLADRMGGLPLLTPAWIVFNSSEFQGAPDMLPILPAVAFWVGWAFFLVGRPLAARPRAAAVLASLLIAAFVAYGFRDAHAYRPAITLDQEIEVVNRILGDVGEDDPIVGFDASEIYVLTERPAPVPFVSLNAVYAQFADLLYPTGCRGLERHLAALQPRVVVINEHPWQSACVKSLRPMLRRRGYVRSEVAFPFPQHRRLTAEHPDVGVIAWGVYTRPEASSRSN